jgi:PQQ-dependent catabolism-associated CXXCW motif protein
MTRQLAARGTVCAAILAAGVAWQAACAQNYPPPQGGYPPQQGGYPPQQGGYPPQQGGYAPAQPNYGQGQGQPGYGGGGNPGTQDLDQLMAWEREDMGVAATKTLHSGPPHGPTPNQIPGGQVITTKGLVALLQNNQVSTLVLDVLGAQQQLPNAQSAVPASQAGTFSDQTQQQFGQYLQQATRGNKATPIVLYCQGPHCWMSYNAALRAINLGYKNVLWYRGGIEAWERAGLPFANGQAAPQQPMGAPNNYAGGQPGAYQGGQSGGYPGGQPGSYQGGQPGGYQGGQPGGYQGGQPGGYK